jgi:tetratricopeptide (TPR) repeat protein
LKLPFRFVIASALGAAMTPVAPLLVCGGRWEERRIGLSAAVLAVWAAGAAFALTRAWPAAACFASIAAWNALASAALESLIARAGETRTYSLPALDPAAVALTATLGWAFATFMAALITIGLRMSMTETTRLLGPDVFLWGLPGALIGASLGAAWFGRTGSSAGRVAISSLTAAHGIYAGIIIATVAGCVSLIVFGVNPMSAVDPNYSRWKLYGALPGLVIVVLGASWAGSALSVGRLALRALATIALWVGFVAMGLVAFGVHSLWHSRTASNLISEPSLEKRALGIERLRAALVIRPSSPDWILQKWSIAEESLTQGRDERAGQYFKEVAAATGSSMGQEYIVRAKRLLAGRGTGRSAYREASGVLAVEHTDYLDSNWRAALGLWRSAAPAEPTTASLSRLRGLSVSEKNIRLPRMTDWMDLAAYSSAYGAAVTVGPVDTAAVRRALDSGRPVLIRRRGLFLLVIGYDASWNAYRFLDYRCEPPWLVAQQARAEAAASVGEDEGARLERLAALRRLLAEWMGEKDLLQALSDSQGVAAIADAKPRALDRVRRSWLLGEAAANAGDPVLALDRYEKALASGAGDWILPYIRASALMVERSGVEKRALGIDPRQAQYRAWRSGAGRPALLARAAGATARARAHELPSRVLERLIDSLDPSEPAESRLRADAFEQLAERFPEEARFLTGLSEARQEAGDAAGWRAAALRLKSINAADAGPLLDAVEASIALGELDAAEELIGQANPFNPKTHARRLSLAGRLELARGRPALARPLLEEAARARRADPEIRRDLARSLDLLGQRAEAVKHWRWVEATSVVPADLEEARKRVGEGG